MQWKIEHAEPAIGLVQVHSKPAAATKVVCRTVESQKASGTYFENIESEGHEMVTFQRQRRVDSLKE